ncbi:hypothetical protein [Cytobacillus horneckiae]|uniref:Uncharacterized protein n=1 Tax=Cytobacillus horneckiae TaxID=549687 RepID=A0A2N0ZE99_9BACI|nr:hypothetical protein [Cytobacillus horneckiae]MEC1157561.1 hypothetical protein [Cytobacillus horneckiae]MED2939509.1 hypothetical protein [Cytobacillus horneckiae]PKG27839.1 hypothetical protein CWS20_17265 [Cytobacillus horneckiae]
MNYEKLHVQTLAGMSVDALKNHYAEVKTQYMQRDGRDTRTQAYLSQVDTWIQKSESVQEGGNQ